MTPKKTLALLVSIAIIFSGAGWVVGRHSVADTIAAKPTAAPDAQRKVLYWYDPMNPGTRFDKPGKSPFMDMDLMPRYADEAHSDGGVQVSARQQQNLGIRTAAVSRQTLGDSVDAWGTVAPDERTMAIIPALAGGLIEKLYVNAPQQFVKKNEALAQLWIPQWAAAQQEYLAVRGLGEGGLTQAARARLQLQFMPEDVIREVERTGKPITRVMVRAPQSGYVNKLDVREGAQVTASQSLFELTGLDTVWVVMDYPQRQAGLVAVGNRVDATTQAWPGQVFQGTIAEVLPGLDGDTRTLKARVVIKNTQHLLKPGMYLHLQRVSDTPAAPVLVIPEEALITTGANNRVLVSQGDGWFTPVTVQAGRNQNGRVEILSGLKEGQQVVTSGQFLIDSEASLRSALPRMADNETAPQTVSGAAKKADIWSAQGVIVGLSADAVTLSHDAIPALKWPPMTMDFAASAAQINGLKNGDKVMFSFTMNDTGARLESIMPLDAMGHEGHKEQP